MTDITDITSILQNGTTSTFSTIISILTIIAWWKIFTKAGEAGWKSIIPVYNGYLLYKLTWKASKFWIVFVSILVGCILIGAGAAVAAAGSSAPGVILILIGVVLFIYGYVLSIIQNFKMAKSFGYGTGFGVGLWLLNTIFVLILGFDKSEYKGAEGNGTAA